MTSFIPNTPPIWQTILAFQLNPTDTTATIASELLISGLPLSGLICVSIDIGQPNPEYAIGTILGNVITFTVRNCDPLNPNNTLGAFGSIHGAGAVVKITDFATIQIMKNLLEGVTPLQNIISYNVPLTPVNPQDIVDKSYVDNVAGSGSADASTTAKGVSRLSASPNVTLGNPTITIASPAVVTLSSHGLTVNDSVQFTTTGVLPNPITAGVTYYVISPATNTFQISLTPGGSAISTLGGSQSGTHTLIKTTPVAVGVNDTRLPTQGQKNAMVGDNIDIPVGSGNPYVTSTGLIHNAEKYAVDGSGSSTAYTATLSPVPTSLTDGMEVYVKINQTNTTTTPTLNVNSLGAKTIKKLGNVALAVGDVVAGFNTFIYDLTNTVWIMQNPIANVVVVNSNKIAVNTGVNTASFNIVIPAGTMGTNNAVKITIPFTGSAGNGQSVSITAGGISGGGPGSVSGNSFSGVITVYIFASGATNSQVIHSTLIQSESGGVSANTGSAVVDTASSFDSTVNYNFPVTITLSGGSLSAYGYLVEAVR